MGITVDAGQQTKAVDDKAVGLEHIRLRGLGVANRRARQLLLNLAQMVLVDNVRRQDEFHAWMAVEIGNDDILVGLPTAAGDEDKGTLAAEALHQRKFLSLAGNVDNAVETGVAHDGNILHEATAGQQFAALLVLHEEMGYVLQHMSIGTAIPTEEYLVGTEDAADAIERNVVVMAGPHVVEPELILDEECHLGTHKVEETIDIAGRVERQVTYHIGPLIVLAHLVARGREEGEQYLVLRILATEAFHQGAPLLKLAKRCSMEPYVAGLLVNLTLQDAKSLVLPFQHFPCLAIKGRYQHDAQLVEIDSNRVQHQPKVSMANCMRRRVSSLPRNADSSYISGP